MIERYRRREESVGEALIDVYLAGVSTRRVDDISQLLWGERMPSQTLSDKLKKVYGDIDSWRTRPLEGEYPYVFMDGVWWIGNGVLDGFLEDESLFGEFLRAPVSEGGVEPLVVGPPHVVVEVMPRLLDRGVVVPVHELLLQQPIRRLDHGVAVGATPARQRSFDVEHVERLVDPRVVEPATPVGVEHLDAVTPLLSRAALIFLAP